ncbi:hypothetical protein XbrCFBP1976_10075 [Xanthomonas bromi]|uniref:Ferredoxin n=1 Tax=Xanthomonas bromi TaxID=56449 RepID=A0ABX5BT88_9XANT|nr:hypothetical protein XbrCFBP1976_10075 [Xanthomonas bromi]
MIATTASGCSAVAVVCGSDTVAARCRGRADDAACFIKTDDPQRHDHCASVALQSFRNAHAHCRQQAAGSRQAMIHRQGQRPLCRLERRAAEATDT